MELKASLSDDSGGIGDDNPLDAVREVLERGGWVQRFMHSEDGRHCLLGGLEVVFGITLDEPGSLALPMVLSDHDLRRLRLATSLLVEAIQGPDDDDDWVDDEFTEDDPLAVTGYLPDPSDCLDDWIWSLSTIWTFNDDDATTWEDVALILKLTAREYEDRVRRGALAPPPVQLVLPLV